MLCAVTPHHSPRVRKLHGIFALLKIDVGAQTRITVTCFENKRANGGIKHCLLVVGLASAKGKAGKN